MVAKTKEYSSGEMRNYIVVHRQVSTPDGSGGQNVTWVLHCAFWADVSDGSSAERYSDSSFGRIRSEELKVFTTWYRTDILVTDRLFWSGEYWNIRGVDDVQNRGKYISISAEKGVEQ